jgi:hypothetical protein
MRAVPLPFSGIPMIGGVDVPSVCRIAPPNRPWLDSTRPIAASNAHDRPQFGRVSVIRRTAWRYALRATKGTSVAMIGAGSALIGTTRPVVGWGTPIVGIATVGIGAGADDVRM